VPFRRAFARREIEHQRLRYLQSFAAMLSFRVEGSHLVELGTQFSEEIIEEYCFNRLAQEAMLQF
jgi:hypothetical protein